MSKKNRRNRNKVEEVNEETIVEKETAVESLEDTLEETESTEDVELVKEDTENETITKEVIEDDVIHANDIPDSSVSSGANKRNDDLVTESVKEIVEGKKPVKKKYDLAGLMVELKGQLTDRELKEWTYTSLSKFKEDGTRVELSKRNNYKQSRIRSLNPSKWTVEELMDWLEGDVEGHRNTRKEDILEEIYLRWKIPSNYTEEDVYGYVIHRKEPEETTNGVLIKDRRREKSKLIDLTYAELASIYLDEVESNFSKSEVKRRIMMISRIISEDQFESKMQSFKEGNRSMSTLSDQLIGTLEARKELYRKYGNRVTDKQLATNAVAFYNTLRRVTKADYPDFSESWRRLLKFADNNYTGVFHPSQIRRGWAMIDLTAGNVTVLDRLLTLIVGTRNPATRRTDVKTINLDHILENITNRKEHENIISFYTED